MTENALDQQRMPVHPFPDEKIAVLYQDDDYGKNILKGIWDGLGLKGLMIVATESYETSTPTINS